ncbi:hypothetical protein CAEBREN_22643 [Caenorhabditis brenneri]|uniref:Uncharacterized protein n=1 Tax=Caenorhabditis brenneri TaxID=135651 RepID=G0NDD9_CAEBE|nr:hypothetical protein CAEBREN_22643 [Caenorhabditis brenneri]
MPPPPKGALHRREAAKHASCLRAARIHEQRFVDAEKDYESRLKTRLLIVEKERDELKIKLENSDNSLIEARNDIVVLTRKIALLEEKTDSLVSDMRTTVADKNKEFVNQQQRTNILQAKVDELVKMTPTAGRAVKQYNQITSKETKKVRYDRVIKLISTLVGPLNVDAFLFDFIRLLDEDPKYSFSLSLSPWDAFFLVVKHQLSDGFLKDFKSFVKERLRFDVFPSRKMIDSVKKEHGCSKYYSIEMQEATDVRTLLSHRLEVLHKFGRLRFDEGTGENIVLGLGGDKGAETTKLVLVLENVDHPNDPHGLLLLGFYSGNDSHSLLKKNFESVFALVDEIETIKYFDGEKEVERKVVKKPLGDCKCISAMYGHAGQNCKTPCYLCNIAWTTHGIHKALLKTFDFTKVGNLRTLAQLKASGDPLINIEPEHAGPPGLHTILGIVQYYIISWLIAFAIRIDLGKSSSSSSLQEQRKEMKTLSSDVEKLEVIVNDHESASEKLNNITEVLEKRRRTVKPKPVSPSHCSSSFCIVGSSRKSLFREASLFQCKNCGKISHDICAFVVTEEDRLETKRSGAKCIHCHHGPNVSIDNLLAIAREMREKKETELQQAEDLLEITEIERLQLENFLKGSSGSTRQLLEAALRSIGCDNRIWYQELTGNQARKLLRRTSITKVLNVFLCNTNIQLSMDEKRELELMRLVMEDLASLMSSASNSVKTDDEISDIGKVLQRFAQNLKEAQPDATVTPKLHLLCGHLLPYLKLHRIWCRVTEQGIESLHCLFNKVNVRYASVRDPILRATLIVDRLAHYNLLFDVGSSWFLED